MGKQRKDHKQLSAAFEAHAASSAHYSHVNSRIEHQPSSTYQARQPTVNNVFGTIEDNPEKLARLKYDTVKPKDLWTYNDSQQRPRGEDVTPEAVEKKRRRIDRTEAALLGSNDLEEMANHFVNPFRMDRAFYHGHTPSTNAQALERYRKLYDKVIEQYMGTDKKLHQSVPLLRRATIEKMLRMHDPANPKTRCLQEGDCVFSSLCRKKRHPLNPTGEHPGHGLYLYPHESARMSVEMRDSLPPLEQTFCVFCAMDAVCEANIVAMEDNGEHQLMLNGRASSASRPTTSASSATSRSTRRTCSRSWWSRATPWRASTGTCRFFDAGRCRARSQTRSEPRAHCAGARRLRRVQLHLPHPDFSRVRGAARAVGAGPAAAPECARTRAA